MNFEVTSPGMKEGAHIRQLGKTGPPQFGNEFGGKRGQQAMPAEVDKNEKDKRRIEWRMGSRWR